jgi:hypothetical protein
MIDDDCFGFFLQSSSSRAFLIAASAFVKDGMSSVISSVISGGCQLQSGEFGPNRSRGRWKVISGIFMTFSSSPVRVIPLKDRASLKTLADFHRQIYVFWESLSHLSEHHRLATSQPCRKLAHQRAHLQRHQSMNGTF